MGRRKYSAQEREALLKGLANCKEGISVYAKAQGVSVGTLYKWQQQAGQVKPDPGAGFVEIGQPVSFEEKGSLILRMGDVSLRFEALPEAGWLAVLVEKLSR